MSENTPEAEVAPLVGSILLYFSIYGKWYLSVTDGW